jgi:hypothetical protein
MARGRTILIVLALASFLVALLGLARGLEVYNAFQEQGSDGVDPLWVVALTQWLVLPFLLLGAAFGLLNGRKWGRTLLIGSSVPFAVLGGIWDFVPGLSLPGFFLPGLAWALIAIGLAHLSAVGLILKGGPAGQAP